MGGLSYGLNPTGSDRPNPGFGSGIRFGCLKIIRIRIRFGYPYRTWDSVNFLWALNFIKGGRSPPSVVYFFRAAVTGGECLSVRHQKRAKIGHFRAVFQGWSQNYLVEQGHI